MTEDSTVPLWKKPTRWLMFCILLEVVYIVFPLLSTAVSGAGADRWTSILPPLVAVSIALCFHTLVWALIGGFVVGCLFSYWPITAADWPQLLTAVPRGSVEFLWDSLRSQFKIYIFGFLFALLGMIHVTYRSGGIHGLIGLLNRAAKGPRSTRFATFMAGLIVFFDDYSNTVVVGSTMRALCDKNRISREKLAYLVDSTAAPVAGLALLSTWIAGEVFFLGQAGARLGLAEDGYTMFVKMALFRFYCWGTLIFVALSSILGRDFGAMYKAECRAATEGKLLADTARPIQRRSAMAADDPTDVPHRWYNAAIPLAVVIFGTLGGVLLLGRAKVLADGGSFSFLSTADVRAAIGMVTNPYVTPGGAMMVLFFASLAGGATAVLLAAAQRLLGLRQVLACYARAIPTLAMAFFILTMAWGMGAICTHENGVHTDLYLTSLLQGTLPLTLLPLLVFLIASGLAFSTGTSFGTMSILIPVVLPLAYALGAYTGGSAILFWLTAAAIMDGAIFGDHCSPISDTTVLSSLAAHCDHIDHVRTQIPYALTVMGLAALPGYLLVALGMPGWTYFVLFPTAVLVILFTAGRRVPMPGEPALGKRRLL